MPQRTTRAHIIETADQLFYEKGYAGTSFADIAGALKISRGNFYHHFKTKDEILNAVIDLRIENTHEMLKNWDQSNNDPVKRIRSFVNILIQNRAKIMSFGCPVGTLTNELSKLDHAALADAKELFQLFRVWLKNHFIAAGCGKKSDDNAMHLLSLSQGAATVASAFKDEKFINAEVQRINAWIDSVIELQTHS